QASAQQCGSELPGATKLQASGYALMFRTQPAKIALGQHFNVEMQVCSSDGGEPKAVTVDAFMPEHRHGMNYRPTIKTLGPGRFEADALMFHMPGRWEFHFHVERAGGGTDRPTSSLTPQRSA